MHVDCMCPPGSVCVSETGTKEGGRARKLHLTCQGLGLLRPRALVKADCD